MLRLPPWSIVLLATAAALPLAAQAPARAVHLADAEQARCGWGTAHDDRSVEGDALAVGEVVAPTGIGTHAPAELVWAVPAGASWFTCWFGVAAERGPNGSITLEAWCDGERRFVSPLQRGGMEPGFVVVPVAGQQRLRLVVTDGGDGNGADHANLLWPEWRVAAVAPEAALPAPVTFGGNAAPALAAGPMLLWSDRPARRFVEAYPLGDGRVGATWFGGVAHDRIVLNEITMWSGSVDADADRAHAHQDLPRIHDLLLAGKYVAAEQLVNATFTCAGAGSGHGNGKDVPFGCYQVLGELEITWLGADGAPLHGEVRDYQRVVRPASFGDCGRQSVQFTIAGQQHRRELSIGPDGLVTLDGDGDWDLRLCRRERATVVAIDDRTLELTGTLADGRGGDGVRFAARLRALGKQVWCDGDVLRVRGGGRVFVLAATDFPGLGAAAGARSMSAAELRALLAARLRPARWTSGLQDALAYYWRDAGRLALAAHPAAVDQLVLDGPDRRSVPTALRLRDLAHGQEDPALFATYFRFGRHLLQSASRPGSLPANLQGLWAPEYQTPWNGDYHLDINVQMNYWPALATNLIACDEPLVRLIESLVEPGRRTARAYYDAPGWVAHVITNVWGFTSPGEHASWGATNSGSGWLCRHLFEHWAFTQDRAFLQRVYPVLKAAAQFYLATLVVEPAHGWLVTGVSNSPENAFRTPDGQVAHVCMGPTIDQQILRELFASVIEAASVLGVDAEFAQQLATARAKLAPNQVGRHGQLQEWLQDFDEVEPHHRHVSHLYGLWPGDEITPVGTPELAAAARVTLDRRGDDGTGWALANKAAMWARLGDGDRALQLLTRLLRPTGQLGFDMQSGGTYPNLFCAHPPFQIDGNLGGTAAIAELLLQSHRERQGEPFTIHLLPALPTAWRGGAFHELRARGAVLVSARWRDGALVDAALRRVGGPAGPVRVRCRWPVLVRVGEREVAAKSIADGVFEFELGRQQAATLRAR